MVFSILSTTFSIIALIISIFLLHENYLKRFNLFVQIGKKNPWANGKDIFQLDLLIYMCNLGMKVGLIEEISVKIENRDDYITMEPDVFYKVSPKRNIQPYDFWGSFLLFGKKTFSEFIKFVPHDVEKAKIDLMEEGKKKAILDIVNKKNLKVLNH